MQLNVITGLPRAGSTLMCNILNQNPKFWATSTSVLPTLCAQIVSNWSNSVEVRNMLEKEREKTEDKMYRSLRAFIEEWSKKEGKEIIFDKSRGWAFHSLLLKKLYPDSKIIVMVRDLRNVFASVEKQHRKTPLLEEANTATGKTLFARADSMFSQNGLIGTPLAGIEDLIRRNPNGVIFVQFESLAQDPESVMKTLYKEMEMDYFEHDFENVKNTANDPDGHYLHKYPHKGEGKVTPLNKEEWKSYVSEDIAGLIMNRFQDYNKFFGYVQ